MATKKKATVPVPGPLPRPEDLASIPPEPPEESDVYISILIRGPKTEVELEIGTGKGIDVT